HFELLEAVPLAGLAPPARDVEREVPGPEPERLRLRQAREQTPDVVECLDVGHGVRSRCPPDRLLVDQPDATQVLEPEQRIVGAWGLELRLEGAGHRAIEGVVDQGGLARARDARDAREGPERDPRGDAPEVVLACPDDREAAPVPLPS